MSIFSFFSFRPFDEVRRLGLQEKTEECVRKSLPEEIGMLVVETVVPDGPAFEFLEEGDILISINGQLITHFVPLESILDSIVDQTISVQIERGGDAMDFSILVQDLHSITPDRYVEIGGAKFNNVSYQLARQFCVPVSGVYLSQASGMMKLESVDQGWIVDSIDAKEIKNLDDLIKVMKEIHDRERVPVSYYSIADVHVKTMGVICMERHWSGFRLVIRNGWYTYAYHLLGLFTYIIDKTGWWDFIDLDEHKPPKPIQPMTASLAELDDSLGLCRKLFNSIVKVHYYIPCRIDGYPRSNVCIE